MERVVDDLNREMARVSDDQDRKSYRDLEQIGPHAEWAAMSFSENGHDLVDLSGYLGRHHRIHGRYLAAKPFYEMSLQQAQKNFEPGHPSIARSQSNLALVLQDLGALEEARDLLRQALRSLIRKFGSEHPKTKIVRENLDLLKSS